MCLCLRYRVLPSQWQVKLGVRKDAFFPVLEKIVYSFSDLLFDIFYNSIDLAYVLQLGEEDLV